MARILVVDDEPAVRGVGRRFLESAGHVVSEADTGKRAVETLLTESFDVVMTDLRMPSASGEALIQWIVTNQPSMQSRILIVTGDARSAGLDSLVGRLKIAVVQKPYQRVDLTDAIDRILNAHSIS